MATAAEIQTAYRAIYRADLNATVASAIAGTGISVDAYIAQQLPQVATTTQAVVAIAAFVTGTAPSSATLDTLTVDAGKQVASYTAMGSSHPELGAYEAFGRAFATDSVTGATFATKYGSLSTTDFINVVYAQVYGTQPNAAQLASLQGQIDYFTKLYAANNVANGAVAAKGAVLGQIVGYAFTSSASANSTLDNQVQSLLTSAAKGDTSVYSKALPTVVDPGQVGVSIAVVAGSVVGTNAADPAFKSTAFNDTISGTVDATNKIDAGAGDDVANLKYGAAVAPATAVKLAQLVNVETLNLDSATAAGKFDVDGATGLKTVGFTNSTDTGEVTNIAAGVNLSVIDTNSAANTSKDATFTFKDASGTNDSANLLVNGIDAATVKVTVAGIENVNVTASGNDSTFRLTDASLKALSVSAVKNVAIDLQDATALDSVTTTGASKVTLTGVANTTKTIDASASTGGIDVQNVGTGAVTLKGGAGADVFKGVSAAGAVVTGGAGNDTIQLTLADNTKVQTVTGGQGGDIIDLGGGKVTAVYLAQSDSTNANFDVLTNFTSGTDKLDFKALNIAGDKTAINTFNAAAALADGTDYFAGKAVAFGTADAGANTYLLVDINNNGKFDVNADMIVKLAGGTVAIGDITFV